MRRAESVGSSKMSTEAMSSRKAQEGMGVSLGSGPGKLEVL